MTKYILAILFAVVSLTTTAYAQHPEEFQKGVDALKQIMRQLPRSATDGSLTHGIQYRWPVWKPDPGAPAQAWPQPPAKRSPIWPPIEFDYPYKGVLTITRVPAPADIRAICPKAYIGRPMAACAQVLPNSCDVFMLPDDLLMAMGLDPDDVYRHEIGHCNGWIHTKE
jgi:hypothetical protein